MKKAIAHACCLALATVSTGCIDGRPSAGTMEPSASSATLPLAGNSAGTAQRLPTRALEEVKAELFAGMQGDIPLLEPLGPVSVVEGQARKLPLSDGSTPSEVKGTDPYEGQFLVVDVRGEYAYRLTLTDEALAAIPDTGDVVAGGPGTIATGQLVDEDIPKNWSTGVDNRIRLAEADGYHETHSSFRRIGRLTGGCTATLVGRKMLMTAAHCLLTESGQGGTFDYFGWDLAWDGQRPEYIDNDFYPRLDQDQVSRYASLASIYYMMPMQYAQIGGCSGLPDCTKWDWAMILTSGPNPAGVVAGGDPNPATNHPGFFGYGLKTNTWLQNNPTVMAGYPACDEADWTEIVLPIPFLNIRVPVAPSFHEEWTQAARPGGWNSTNCTSKTLYGDTLPCGVGGFGPQFGGYAMTVKVGCDGSPGQSGASYFRLDSSGGPIAYGVYSLEDCASSDPQAPIVCGPNDTHEGHFTTLAAYRFDLLNAYRNSAYHQWP